MRCPPTINMTSVFQIGAMSSGGGSAGSAPSPGSLQPNPKGPSSKYGSLGIRIGSEHAREHGSRVQHASPFFALARVSDRSARPRQQHVRPLHVGRILLREKADHHVLFPASAVNEISPEEN